ncbi:MAG: hypothetical protein ACXWC9_07025 [Pseudobdellovibrionaceae bacterium]
MKTKLFAFAISAGLIVNPLAALAQQSPSQLVDLSNLSPEVKAAIPPEVLAKMMAAAQRKTMEDLNSTLASVDTMIAQLNGMQENAEDDLFLKHAKRVQGALVAFNMYATKLHLKDKGASDVMAYLTVATALVNSLIRHWNPTTHSFDWASNEGRIEAKVVNQIIEEATKDIANRPGLAKEVTEAMSQLNQLKGNVDLQKNKYVEMIESFGGSQDAIAGISAISIILHLVSPKLAKYSEKVMSKVMPVIGRAKQGGSVTAGVSGLPDFAGWAFGMGSDETQALLAKTLNSLLETKMGLKESMNKQGSSTQLK